MVDVENLRSQLDDLRKVEASYINIPGKETELLYTRMQISEIRRIIGRSVVHSTEEIEFGMGGEKTL